MEKKGKAQVKIFSEKSVSNKKNFKISWKSTEKKKHSRKKSVLKFDYK